MPVYPRSYLEGVLATVRKDLEDTKDTLKEEEKLIEDLEKALLQEGDEIFLEEDY